MVGDRVDSDLAAAASAGLDAALVITGGMPRADRDGVDPQPVAVADSLSALILR